MQAWKTIAAVETAEGKLELRQRGTKDFLIVIAGRVSSLALARIASARPRVLVGGLGMGYTLRAALDALPAAAHVVVAELTPTVAEWCKGPLASLTDGAVLDPRVTIVIDDVAQVIARARGEYDAILLDLYEGPNPATQGADDPFYSRAALARTHAALVPGGTFAVWSEDADISFAQRFAQAGFDVSTHRHGSSRRHFVYLGHKS